MAYRIRNKDSETKASTTTCRRCGGVGHARDRCQMPTVRTHDSFDHLVYCIRPECDRMPHTFTRERANDDRAPAGLIEVDCDRGNYFALIAGMATSAFATAFNGVTCRRCWKTSQRLGLRQGATCEHCGNGHNE